MNALHRLADELSRSMQRKNERGQPPLGFHGLLPSIRRLHSSRRPPQPPPAGCIRRPREAFGSRRGPIRPAIGRRDPVSVGERPRCPSTDRWCLGFRVLPCRLGVRNPEARNARCFMVACADWFGARS
jgi:hypothetical protein